MPGLLLDTHIWLWYTEGVKGTLSSTVIAEIDAARSEHCLFVSAISVWEIGMLFAKGRITLSSPLNQWVSDSLTNVNLRLQPLDADIALESTLLPGEPHGDPADRFLVATARFKNLRLVTHDLKIIDYGKAGYVQVLAA